MLFVVCLAAAETGQVTAASDHRFVICKDIFPQWPPLDIFILTAKLRPFLSDNVIWLKTHRSVVTEEAESVP